MSYDRLKFQRIDAINDSGDSVNQILGGFAVEVDGEPCGVMSYENTLIHIFQDQSYNYIDVAIDSLARALSRGAEPGPGVIASIPVGASDNLRELHDRLLEDNYPCYFTPMPTQKATKLKKQSDKLKNQSGFQG